MAVTWWRCSLTCDRYAATSELAAVLTTRGQFEMTSDVRGSDVAAVLTTRGHVVARNELAAVLTTRGQFKNIVVSRQRSGGGAHDSRPPRCPWRLARRRPGLS